MLANEIPFLNIKEYKNAIGDGVTNDYTAINAALQYAKSLITGFDVNSNTSSAYKPNTGVGVIVANKPSTVVCFLPRGKYNVTSTLYLPQGVILLGEGIYNTILTTTGSNSILRNEETPALYNVPALQIHNLSVKGNPSGGTSQHGIELLRPVQSTISNVQITYCGGNGMNLFQAVTNTFNQVECSYNIGHGVHVTTGILTWANPTTSGYPSNANDFYGFHGSENNGAGIYLSGQVNGCNFYGATCENNYKSGGNNVGFNIYNHAESITPNIFRGTWTEGPVQAHYKQDASGAWAVFDGWSHYANGASGWVDRAAIILTGVFTVRNATGQNDSYVTFNGSIAPFRYDTDAANIQVSDCAGNLVEDNMFIEDLNGVQDDLPEFGYKINFFGRRFLSDGTEDLGFTPSDYLNRAAGGTVSGVVNFTNDTILTGTIFYANQAGLHRIVNKALSGYVTVFSRDASGSEAVMNMTNIGAINNFPIAVATSAAYGFMKQAAAIANISEADANDLPSVILLANANKAKINALLASLRTAVLLAT